MQKYLGSVQRDVLARMSGKPITARELAALGSPLRAVQAALSTLERRGLVVRDRSEKEYRWSLTPEGATTAKALRRLA